MPRALVLATAFAVGIPVFAIAAAADASPRKGARLTWVRGIGADRCVGALGLEEDVKARLGYDPFRLPPDFVFEGTAVRAPAGFRAELVVRDAQGNVLGTRQLASKDPDCRSVGDAIAVAITVAIDPDAPGTRAVAVEEVPPTAPVEPAPPPAPPPAASQPSVRGRAFVTGGATTGLLPDITFVTSLRARVVATAFEIGLGAHFWPESRAFGLGFALTTGSIDACVAPFARARFVRWCGAFFGGVFHAVAHASDLVPVEVGSFPWAGVETGPAVSFAIAGPVVLDITLSAIAPVTRRQAFLRGRPDPVWEQDPIAGRADVGLGTTF